VVLPLLVGVAATSCTGDTPADASTGQELFGRIGCNGCHTVDGVGGIVGPDLSAVGERPSRDPEQWATTEAYIRASLEDPGQYVVEGYTPDMPQPDLLGIGREDINHLVAYLLTLTSE
jgi:cytochrome c2